MPRVGYTDAQIREAIRLAGGNSERAAERLGCAPSTVYKRGLRLGLDVSTPIQRPRPSTKRARPAREDAQLWAAYHGGDQVAANTIATRHVPLARHVCDRLAALLPPGAAIDADLFGAALLGLLDAMQRFDPCRGVQFATFATARIRGAVLDELRMSDSASRTERAIMNRYEAARASLAHALSRNPTDEEICASLGQPTPPQPRGVVSLETSLWETESGRQRTVRDLVQDPQRSHAVIDHIEEITRELDLEPRMVLWAYFGLGHNLREIGRFLGLSESRTSQIMGRAITDLRKMAAQEAHHG